MRRSLFDRVDLARIRAGAAQRVGPAATLLACLVDGGLLKHDPLDPGWPDRDRLLVGAPHLVRPPTIPGLNWELRRGGAAVLSAVSEATDSRRDGGVFRVWCLLDAGCADGAAWEGALVAARDALDTLTAVVVGEEPAGPHAALWDAAGWTTAAADGSDPVAVVAALDRVLDRPRGPTAVVLA